jgi:hypothetical protein
MDMTAQLKKNLISRIKDSKDLNFLNALQTIFDTSEQALYQINSEQELSIDTSRNEIKNDTFRKNEDVMSEMREWLKRNNLVKSC